MEAVEWTRLEGGLKLHLCSKRGALNHWASGEYTVGGQWNEAEQKDELECRLYTMLLLTSRYRVNTSNNDVETKPGNHNSKRPSITTINYHTGWSNNLPLSGWRARVFVDGRKRNVGQREVMRTWGMHGRDSWTMTELCFQFTMTSSSLNSTPGYKNAYGVNVVEYIVCCMSPWSQLPTVCMLYICIMKRA